MQTLELPQELYDALTTTKNIHELYPILQRYPIETMELFVEPKIQSRIKLNRAQKEFVKTLFEEKRDIYALGSRQIAGKSTIARFAILYALLAYPGITIYYVTLTYKGQGADFVNRLTQMIDYLPENMRISYKRAAQDNSMLIFENGSVLIVAGAQNKTDYADLFKSHSIHLLFVDEFPNIKRNKDLLNAATPTLTAIKKATTDKPVAVVLIGNAIEISSESHKYAYKLWDESTKGLTTYKAILFYYRDLLPDEEADKLIAEEFKRTGSKRDILVNYECYFLTGENAFIDDEIANNIKVKNPVEFVPLPSTIAKLWKHYEDIRDRNIVFGIDIATVYGQDFYAIVGIDAESYDYIFEWTGKVDAVQFIDIVKFIADLFPNSIIAIERNAGAHLLDILEKELPYERLYRDNKSRLGFYTTAQSKSQLFSTLKNILYKKPDIVASRDLFDQLLKLQVTARKIEVDPQLGHDDIIMALAIAVYVIYEATNNLNPNIFNLSPEQSLEQFKSFLDMHKKAEIQDINFKKVETISFDDYYTKNETDLIDLFQNLFINRKRF